MRKTKKQTFNLGLLVVVGLIIFITAIYFIGQKKSMFEKTFTISANFKDVGGLLLGNNVRYSGIDVGTVKSIDMINDSTITVRMMVKKDIVQHIKKDAVATIGSDGLVGSMVVNIVPGEGNEAPIDDGDVIQSYASVGTNEMLKTLSITNKNAAVITTKLLDLVNDISEGKGTLGMLINDTIASHDMSDTFRNLKNASVETNRAVAKFNALINEIDMKGSVAGILLNDKKEAEKIRRTISNLETSGKEIQTVVANLNSTLSNLDKTVINIKEGDGLVNYISNDAAVVKELDEAIRNVKDGTQKFDENMEALKHNFLFRGYFRKLEKQANKEKEKGDVDMKVEIITDEIFK